MVAPIGHDVIVLTAPLQEVTNVRSNPSSKKVRRIVLPLLLILADIAFLSISIESWKNGDKVSLIIAGSINLGALLYLGVYLKNRH